MFITFAFITVINLLAFSFDSRGLSGAFLIMSSQISHLKIFTLGSMALFMPLVFQVLMWVAYFARYKTASLYIKTRIGQDKYVCGL
jgi:hypothetical protein